MMLLTTCLFFVNDQDKTLALLSFPHNIITNAPALDAPSGILAYEASVNITDFRLSTVPNFGDTNFESLFLIFLIILFASIKSFSVGFWFMLQPKFNTHQVKCLV